MNHDRQRPAARPDPPDRPGATVRPDPTDRPDPYGSPRPSPPIALDRPARGNGPIAPDRAAARSRPAEPPDTPTLVDPARLAHLDRAGLTAALRPLWEDAGPLVERLIGRTAGSWDEQIDQAEHEIAGMDPATQAALLRAHPRIGADPATLASLSPLSHREQGAAAHPDTSARLDELNRIYEERFGFPFVEWVAGRPKEAMVAVLEHRSTRPVDVERAAGCRALVAIARDRLRNLRSEVA